MDLSKLKEPFDPDRISWRIGVTRTGDAGDVRGLALAYLDARDVQDRLDAVCGPENWSNRFLLLGATTVCEIGIRVAPGLLKAVDNYSEVVYPSDWVWKADGAGATDIEAEKGALSDSFKRSAVKWGIGRYLYDIESPWVRLEPMYPGAKQMKIAASEKDRLRKLLSGVKTTMAEQKEVEKKSEAQIWVDQSIEAIFQFEKEAELRAWETKATAAIVRLGKVNPALHERLLEKIMLRYEQLGKAA